MNKDIRWKQRFNNYLKAVQLLKRCIPESTSDFTEQGMLAIIQAFEIVEELSWNLINDYLKRLGIAVRRSTIDTIRQALNKDIISETQAEVLIEAVEDRNLTSHSYNDDVANKLVTNISDKFLPVFDELAEQFSRYYEQDD